MAETTADRKRKKGEGPNIVALTPDARLALHFGHVDKIKTLEDEARSVNGRLRAARKVAKGDLGDEGLKEIDMAIWANSENGQAEIKAEMDRMIRVASWHGTDLGGQISFLSGLPPRDFANEGKLAGLRGHLCKPPDGLSQADAQTWMEGWGLGQAVLVEAFGKHDPAEKDEHASRVRRETKAAEKAAATGRPDEDERDLRAPFMKSENQQHPKDKPAGEPAAGDGAPAVGSAPSTIKKLHH